MPEFLSLYWDNIVSLGFFCGVAEEMEIYGLRSCSSPFDWLITGDFEIVLNLIKDGFSSFLNRKKLAQFSSTAHYYYDFQNQIHFYHDFNSYQPLILQYFKVKRKYKKRIQKFYRNISDKTLFIRYCASDSVVNFINDNYNNILHTLKGFNPENEILFIKNSDSNDSFNPGISFFEVEKDCCDSVCRRPFHENRELKNFVQSPIISDEKREQNLKFLKEKQNIVLNDSFFKKCQRKFWIKLFGGDYKYKLQYCYETKKVYKL